MSFETTVSYQPLAKLKQEEELPPHVIWRMNQGNVVPGFSEQAVTWTTLRSDFLPVPYCPTPLGEPIPHPAEYPVNVQGSIKLNLGRVC